MRALRLLALSGLIAFAAVPATTASARWFGSTMKGGVNYNYGCGQAIVSSVYGIGFQPTHRTTCTYRHGGYLFRNRFTAIVPGTGVIRRIRVKSGRRPAKLKVTILTGSSRVSTFDGRDLPGTYTCCTARSVGKAFRPRANRTTVRKVHFRVYDVRSKKIRYRIHSTDIVALTAVGKGSLPIHVRNDVGNYTTGIPTAIGFWPSTRLGDPRVDGYPMTGLDLLFGWTWSRH